MPRKKKHAPEQPVNPVEPAVAAGVAVAEPAPVIPPPCPSPALAAADVPRPAELPPPVVAESPPTVAPKPEARALPRPVKTVRTPPAPSAQVSGWASPYTPLFVCEEKGFEMGEHRRFKQRVFLFNEKPADQIRATLKEHGFTYRPAERAWTIPASAENRVLSDQLAKEFAGRDQGRSR